MNSICNLGMGKDQIKLSPSTIMKLQSDPMDWFRVKIKKEQKQPQTLPMAIGSSFDTKIKTWLWKEIMGQDVTDAGSSVELTGEDRETVMKDGQEVFEFYKNSGALASLVQEIEMRQKDHHVGLAMENWLEAELDLGDGILLPLCGRPDLAFWLQCKKLFVLDFKVNGFYSKSNTSPRAGYTICRDKYGHQSRYKSYIAADYCGISYNKLYTMDAVNEDWSLQTLCYFWMLIAKLTGNTKIKVEEELLCGVDQILGQRCNRVSSFRGLISPLFQQTKIDELKILILKWDSMIIELEEKYAAMQHDPNANKNDQWFSQILRG